jgi:tRNA1(Val) A37 N6-methylase TrmN6
MIPKKFPHNESNPNHYTPIPIIRYILLQTLKSFPRKQREPITILDPACGSGLFLTEALTFLSGNFTKKRMKFLGIDIDPQAKAITEANIAKKNQEIPSEFASNVEIQIITGNTIRDDLSNKFRDFPSEGFDFIIGNPPYRLLQPESTTPEELQYYRGHFTVAQYKIDLYHLFLERCIELLGDGGRLGFIIPNTFLTNVYCSKLREFLLRRAHIEEITFIPKSFMQVDIENVILILTKKSHQEFEPEHRIRIRKFTSIEQLALDASVEEFFIPQQQIENTPKKIFRIPVEARNQIKIPTIPLGSIARIHFGLQTPDRRKFPDSVITSAKLPPPPYRPCISGKDITPNNIRFNNTYVKFDPETQAGGCWDPTMHFRAPKVVIRQIGAHPIAAVDPIGYACLNTIFMVVSIDSRYSADILAAIINSAVIREYWGANYGDHKRLFPKIKKTFLQEIPIPDLNHLSDDKCRIWQQLENHRQKNSKNSDQLITQLYYLE